MKKTFLISIFVFFLTGFGYAHSYDPMIYDDGWVKLSESELTEKMNSPVININTGEPFNLELIKKNTKEVDPTNTPFEYYQNALDGYDFIILTTYDIIDRGLFRAVAVPLIYYYNAKPARYSYVRDFCFTKEDPVAVLPPDFVWYAGSDQRRYLERAKQQGLSWRDVSPNARIIERTEETLALYDTFAEDFYNRPDERKYTGDSPSHVISVNVVGDLNNDGYEDLVVRWAHFYVGGSGRSYHFAVLTRTSEDGVFKDITNEVNRIIWRPQK